MSEDSLLPETPSLHGVEKNAEVDSEVIAAIKSASREIIKQYISAPPGSVGEEIYNRADFLSEFLVEESAQGLFADETTAMVESEAWQRVLEAGDKQSAYLDFFLNFDASELNEEGDTGYNHYNLSDEAREQFLNDFGDQIPETEAMPEAAEPAETSPLLDQIPFSELETFGNREYQIFIHEMKHRALEHLLQNLYELKDKLDVTEDPEDRAYIEEQLEWLNEDWNRLFDEGLYRYELIPWRRNFLRVQDSNLLYEPDTFPLVQQTLMEDHEIADNYLYELRVLTDQARLQYEHLLSIPAEKVTDPEALEQKLLVQKEELDALEDTGLIHLDVFEKVLHATR